MLRDGVGLSQDKSMALKFLRQAAESNYGDAELLAQFLEQEGVKLPVKHQASAKKSSASTKKSGVSKKSGSRKSHSKSRSGSAKKSRRR